mgnify:CR=1 FL=1
MQNIYKDIYAYNLANNPSNYAGQTWNTGSSSWINDIQFSYGYNDLDYLINSEQKSWINGGWENVESADYTHTTFGSIESMLLATWNGNIYVNSALTQSNYEEYGNATDVYYYNWS